jgi:hypothetical protein
MQYKQTPMTELERGMSYFFQIFHWCVSVELKIQAPCVSNTEYTSERMFQLTILTQNKFAITIEPLVSVKSVHNLCLCLFCRNITIQLQYWMVWSLHLPLFHKQKKQIHVHWRKFFKFLWKITSYTLTVFIIL